MPTGLERLECCDQLVLRAQPQHLRLGLVQSQLTRAEPGLDIIETAGKTVNRSRRMIVDWRAGLDLTVICVLM